MLQAQEKKAQITIDRQVIQKLSIEVIREPDGKTAMVVKGIPSSMTVAFSLLGDATRTVAEHFVREALKGNVSDNDQPGRIVTPSRIMVPKTGFKH